MHVKTVPKSSPQYVTLNDIDASIPEKPHISVLVATNLLLALVVCVPISGNFHPEEEHYVCQDCTKKFDSPSELKRHQRIHTGEATLNICPTCNKSFSTKSNLNMHIRNQHKT